MRKALKRARRTLRTYRDSFGNIVRGSRESLERLAQPEVSDEPRAEANPLPQALPGAAEPWSGFAPQPSSAASAPGFSSLDKDLSGRPLKDKQGSALGGQSD